MVVRMSLPVMLLGQAGMPSVPMHTRNISTSGIGFLSKRVFKKGEVIGVHLLAGHRISKLMLCRVTFCRYVRSGLHEVGAEFVEARPVFGGVPRIPTTWIEQAQRGAKAAAGLS